MRRFAVGTPIWPKSSLWVVVGAVCILFAGSALLAPTAYWYLTRTTVDDVERMLDDELALGSSADQVVNYLDFRGIEHDPPRQFDPGASCCILQDAAIAPGTLVIPAIIRDSMPEWIFGANIRIYFVFNDRGSFSSYIARETYTGP